MCETPKNKDMTRREMLGTVGKAAAVSVVLPPFLPEVLENGSYRFQDAPLAAQAGPDRVVVMPGKTYINSWAGYGLPPNQRPRPRRGEAPPPPPTGPEPRLTWSKESGPGTVSFADANALSTTATFSAPGAYVVKLTADNGEDSVTSTFNVLVEHGPPADHLDPVTTKPYSVDNRLWNRKVKALIVSWIPHCIDMINRDDLELGPGGIDNFLEAAKALRGEPHGTHKGYVFSNAWVHQTVESMSIALMVDAKGDSEILAAQEKFKATLEDWIPKILAAQHPDGYLQTAFTLRTDEQKAGRWPDRWTPQGRSQHEGYVAGYFIESAINHHVMTQGRDTRLYDAAKKLCDCWDAHIGPPPKQEWFDGHQEMEQALVRFGRYVNEAEGGGRGDRYIALAKFLLDCRKDGSEYDQSHVPSVQQYEAVGHAVRAVYQYSAVADVAMETRDVDYQSAARSLWDSIVNKKYYVTGGVGSGETSEGFGPEYSLRNNSYCESCSSCGEVFLQSKMNRMYKEAKYADLYEETLYNALFGSMDLEAKHFYYDNPLDANVPRYEWHTCPCCVGNIPRTLLMLPTWTYAKGQDGLYVNLFIGSTITVEGVGGTDVEVVQETEYPWDGKVAITINPKAAALFSLRIRVPDRQVSSLYTATPDANGITSLAVNGTPVEPTIENGYAVITRAWTAGDKVELELPLRVQRVRGDERIEATRGKVALRYGPLVYNIEKADQDIDLALGARSPLTTEWREDFLGGVTVIKGTFANGAPMTAIPNYARYNREEGTFAPRRPEPNPDGTRGPAFPPTSVVWMREA